MSFYLSDSYTLLLILFSVFIGIVSWLDNQRILLLIESPFNQKYNLKYPRFDSIFFTFFCSVNILIIKSILISFYVFQESEKMSFTLFFQIAILLTIWMLVKFIILFTIGRLLEMNNEIQKYYHEYFTKLLLLSIFFFPIIMVTSYSFNGELLNKYSIYCFYLFILSYLIMKCIHLKRLNLFKVRLIFYNILYLYTLEILPYLILFKLLQAL